MKYYVYTLLSLKDNKFYTRFTIDLKDRFSRHSPGEVNLQLIGVHLGLFIMNILSMKKMQELVKFFLKAVLEEVILKKHCRECYL